MIDRPRSIAVKDATRELQHVDLSFSEWGSDARVEVIEGLRKAEGLAIVVVIFGVRAVCGCAAALTRIGVWGRG